MGMPTLKFQLYIVKARGRTHESLILRQLTLQPLWAQIRLHTLLCVVKLIQSYAESSYKATSEDSTERSTALVPVVSLFENHS